MPGTKHRRKRVEEVVDGQVVGSWSRGQENDAVIWDAGGASSLEAGLEQGGVQEENSGFSNADLVNELIGSVCGVCTAGEGKSRDKRG